MRQERQTVAVGWFEGDLADAKVAHGTQEESELRQGVLSIFLLDDIF